MSNSYLMFDEIGIRSWKSLVYFHNQGNGVLLQDIHSVQSDYALCFTAVNMTYMHSLTEKPSQELIVRKSAQHTDCRYFKADATLFFLVAGIWMCTSDEGKWLHCYRSFPILAKFVARIRLRFGHSDPVAVSFPRCLRVLTSRDETVGLSSVLLANGHMHDLGCWRVLNHRVI